MRTARFQQLGEGMLFMFEPRFFSGTIMAYDARLANQTIISAWGTSQLESEDYRAIERLDETPAMRDVSDLSPYPVIWLDD